jgi:hypothetical protein
MKRITGFRKAALASLLCVVGASAQAVPFINEWNVDQEFEWTEWTDDGDTGGTGIQESDTSASVGPAPYGDNVSGWQTLSWSDDDANTSSVQINDGDGTTTNTNAFTATEPLDISDFALGPKVAHDNQTLNNNTESLDTAQATDFIVLAAADPALGPLDTRTLTYDINFTETPNALTGTDCPSGNPDGVSCRDIFTIAGPGLTGESVDVTGTDDDAFVIDSFIIPGDPGNPAIEYTVFLLAEGLGILDDAICAAAGADPNCFGLVTDENANNVFQLQYAITAREIPEPAAILLIGLGLLGMAGLRRSRRDSQVTA